MNEMSERIIKSFFKNNNLTQEQWNRICLNWDSLSMFAPENESLKSLPDNMVIDNSFSLYKTKVTKLPEKLSVGDSFYLYGLNLELPNSLYVGYKIYVYTDQNHFYWKYRNRYNFNIFPNR